MSRSRLAIWNYSSAWLFTAVTFVGLIVTRYLVLWLGEDRFGAFRMMTDWLGYLNLLELGLSGALSPLLARSLATGDRTSLRQTMATGLRIFLLLTVATLMIALGFWAVISWLIPVSPEYAGDLRLAWGISLVSLVPMALAPFRCLSDARQRGYRINLALTLQSLTIFGLSLLFARIGWGITGQALATILAVLPLVVTLIYDGVSHSPGVVRATFTERSDPAVLRSLAALAIPTFLIGLCSRVSILTDSLVVGKLLGLSMATRLVLTTKLAVMAQGQLQNIGGASWAALAELHSQGRRDDFNRRLIELTGLVALLGMAGLVPIVAYNRYFIGLWVGEERYAGDWVILLASINAFLLGLFSLWFWCFSGTGQVKRMLPVTILMSTVNLSASIVFTKQLGVVGPVLGSTLSFVSVNLWYLPIELRRTFGTSIRGLWLAWLVPVAWGIPYSALVWVVSRTHEPWGWIGLAAEMGLGALGFLVLGAFAILKPEERAVWTSRIGNALPFLKRGPIG